MEWIKIDSGDGFDAWQKGNYRLSWNRRHPRQWRLYNPPEFYERYLIAAFTGERYEHAKAQAWADKIIAEREGTMDLDKIKAELKTEVWQEITSRIKAVHDRETCETTRKVLKEIMGKKEHFPHFENVQIILNTDEKNPYLLIPIKDHLVNVLPDTQLLAINLNDGWQSKLHEPEFWRHNRFMDSGTITMTIKEGKIAKAEVKEE